MLEGKPVKSGEAVTVESIKSILADYEAEFEAAEAQPERVATRQPKTDDVVDGLQPVAVVETKVARPKFTTVPNSDQQNAVARTVNSKMAGAKAPSRAIQRSNSVADGTPAPTTERPRRGLSKLSLPKLAFPKLGRRTEPAPQPTAQPEPVTQAAPEPMAMLREATAQTEVSPVALALSRARTFITPRRLVLLGFVLFALLRPATFIFLFILTVFAVVGTFVFAGAERVWDVVARMAKWYTERRPDRKDAVYDWLDDIAVRWDGCLDRFPEGTVDSLYMPDFSNIDEIERQHDAIVTDRLNRMQSQA